MICARAELAALLMKAARGAGVPLALAEDLYQMADYVSVEDVALLAKDIEEGGAQSLALTLALDDLACGREVDLSHVLATPMAAARGWVLCDGVRSDGEPAAQKGPLDIPATVLDALGTLAAQTYVPDSAASRARGAGAGAIDND